MIPTPKENINDVIHTAQNEIELLKFHKETLEMKIKYLRPKLESPIKIVGSVKQDTYFPNEKTTWTEKDVPVREEFFYANNELIEIVHTINAKQLALGMHLAGLKKAEETQQKGVDKHKMAALVSEAKELYLIILSRF